MEKEYDPKQRAQEKKLQREKDEADLALGKKSPDDLRRENSAFGFPPGKVRIGYDKAKRLS